MKKKNPKKKKNNKNGQNDKKQMIRQALLWILGIFVVIQLVGLFSQNMYSTEKLTYSEFYKMLENNQENPQIYSVEKTKNKIVGQFFPPEGGKKFEVYVPKEDEALIKLLKENVEEFKVSPAETFWTTLLYSFAPILLFIAFLWYFAYRGSKQVGGSGGLWSFGKMKGKLVEQEKTKVKFTDVAGTEEAKEELQEVVTFLKDPSRFQNLGGKIPKGVLLVGPPGCGKTLIAKAVSGEAGVPFYSISGSDFVEMFVGVGASRVRDLFEQAKKTAKISAKGCIVFIDELDAVGRQRFSGIGGGHDEREQTLNQLLVGMDGFEPNTGIIVLAATNRPDVLDPALLRPGRFDRHIIIDKPDVKGREEILKVHIKNIKVGKGVDLNAIARQTPGFSGADIANLCNEAALLAGRKNKKEVSGGEMQEAIERVMAGPQRKSRVISKKEKNIVAVHEAGHALLSLFLPNSDPLHKVSIIPRGVGALGYTMQLPLQDRYIITKEELFSRICGLLGGRIAEHLVLGQMSSGAQNDFDVATKLASKMVKQFGMSDKLGSVTLGEENGPVFLGRDLTEHKNYSEQTARLIDEEIKKIIDQAYKKSEDIIKSKLDKLKILSSTLLEKEVLEVDEVKKILGVEDNKKEEVDNKNEENASSSS